MEWLNQHAAGIQAVAAMGIFFLTVVLVWATWKYASLTKEALRLSRKQFEQEWRPDLHVEVRRFSGDNVSARITNLAKSAVLLKSVLLRVEFGTESPGRAFSMHVPLPVGESKDFNIYYDLVKYLTENGLIPPTSRKDQTWKGLMQVAVRFYTFGELGQTEWVEFRIVMRNGEVYGLEPPEKIAER